MSAEASASSSTPKTSKPRAAQACSKMRCDGSQPCGRCSKNGHTCTYEVPVNGVSPALAASFDQRIATLEQRMEALEQRQTALERAQLAPMRSVMPIMPGSGLSSMSSLSSHGVPMPPPPLRSPSMTDHYVDRAPSGSRMDLSNLLVPPPDRDEPEAKRRRYDGSVTFGSRIRRQLDVIDAGLVSETDARQLYHRYLNIAEDEYPYIASAPRRFEEARARSPLYLAACLTVGARVWPQTQKQYSLLAQESVRLARLFLYAEPGSGQAAMSPFDVLACIILASYHGIHRLVFPVHQAAHRIKLDARVETIEALLKANETVTADLVEELRIYIQAQCFANAFAIMSGTDIPPHATPEAFDRQVELLNIHPHTVDGMLVMAGRICVNMAALADKCIAAKRAGPTNWAFICDRVDEHLAALDEAEGAAAKDALAIDPALLTRGIFGRHSLTISRCLWRIYPRAHAIGTFKSGQELLDQPRRLEHAKEVVELTNTMLDVIIGAEQWTLTGKAWMLDPVMMILGPATTIALSVALVCPHHIDFDRFRGNMARFLDALKPLRVTDGFRQNVEKLLNRVGGGPLPRHRPALSFERGSAETLSEPHTRTLDDEEQSLLDTLLTTDSASIWPS